MPASEAGPCFDEGRGTGLGPGRVERPEPVEDEAERVRARGFGEGKAPVANRSPAGGLGESRGGGGLGSLPKGAAGPCIGHDGVLGRQAPKG